MKKASEKKQSFGDKLALFVIGCTFVVGGIIATNITIEGEGNCVWLHTIGVIVTMLSLIFFDAIEGKWEFLDDFLRHKKSVLNLLFK